MFLSLAVNTEKERKHNMSCDALAVIIVMFTLMVSISDERCSRERLQLGVLHPPHRRGILLHAQPGAGSLVRVRTMKTQVFVWKSVWKRSWPHHFIFSILHYCICNPSWYYHPHNRRPNGCSVLSIKFINPATVQTSIMSTIIFWVWIPPI